MCRCGATIEVLAVQSTAGYRFRATMVGGFAALALAMIGVFGVLAYTVQRRRREIGVRIALGASGARVMGLVFRDAGVMIAAGVIGGVAQAAFASRLIAAFLFGVDPLDPLTCAAVPVVILLTAIAAAIPAWREPHRARRHVPPGCVRQRVPRARFLEHAYSRRPT